MAEIAERVENKTHYLADLERLQPVPQDWVNELRRKAVDEFTETAFPTRKMEPWRFTNVAPIVRTAFRSPVEPGSHGLSEADVAPLRYGEADWTELVFVDGFYAPELSSPTEGVRAGSLSEAFASDAGPVQQHLNRYLNGSGNAFTALNTAFLLDGAYVHVAKEQAVPSPIHILHVSTGGDGDTASHPRNLIVADRHAEATFVESHVSLAGDKTYFKNTVTEISVGEGAKVHWYKLLHEGPNGYHLSSTRVHQERNSAFKSFSIFQGAKIARNDLSVVLDGEGADASLNGLYMTDGDQLVDNATAVDHAKPHCTSWIGYKGVLEDKSHGVFSGKVMVRRDAQKTDSNQLNQNMVLSDKATIDTKPLLEIFADDVKCTHGATVGRPPKELVFYFQTRGMSEAMALGMLTYGFADEVVNQIEVDPVRARLEKFVYNKYSPIPG
ncbi:MAG: Fe-S cluster assembly protein SufD [Candidatus Hydrogenedentes bacterium]|nr:Fe-S cluster assembly protein SufD [Candidatus Hydrogenedentota bacterium]